MIKQEKSGVKMKQKTYTGQDLILAAKEIFKSDEIGKKLPDEVLEQLSRLVAKSTVKGDL
jgi:hypothetical protein